jgi:hypothetical protein
MRLGRRVRGAQTGHAMRRGHAKLHPFPTPSPPTPSPTPRPFSPTLSPSSQRLDAHNEEGHGLAVALRPPQEEVLGLCADRRQHWRRRQRLRRPPPALGLGLCYGRPALGVAPLPRLAPFPVVDVERGPLAQVVPEAVGCGAYRRLRYLACEATAACTQGGGGGGVARFWGLGRREGWRWGWGNERGAVGVERACRCGGVPNRMTCERASSISAQAWPGPCPSTWQDRNWGPNPQASWSRMGSRDRRPGGRCPGFGRGSDPLVD